MTPDRIPDEASSWTPVAWALRHATAGWRVIPAAQGSKHPGVRSWPNRATSDLARVQAWWTATPEANIFGVCDDKVVIDIDPRNGGHTTFARLDERHGFGRTRAHRTGGFVEVGGERVYGRHLVYHNPDGHTVPNELGPGVEVKTGRGRGVLLPGSVHPQTGEPYVVIDDAVIAQLPRMVASLARSPGKVGGGPMGLPGVLARLGPNREQATAPSWAEWLREADPAFYGLLVALPAVDGHSDYVLAALDEECDTVAGTAKGGRNDALNSAAFSLGTLVGAGLLDPWTTLRRLWEAARRCGLLDDPDDGPAKTLTTIRSGLGDGVRNPRVLT